MRDSAARWAERVAEWRRSGKTAPAFVAGTGITVSALKYWATKLKSPQEQVIVPARSLSLARVIRPGMEIPAPKASAVDDSVVEVVVDGGARIVVRPGFDPNLVRELVAALTVSK